MSRLIAKSEASRSEVLHGPANRNDGGAFLGYSVQGATGSCISVFLKCFL